MADAHLAVGETYPYFMESLMPRQPARTNQLAPHVAENDQRQHPQRPQWNNAIHCPTAGLAHRRQILFSMAAIALQHQSCPQGIKPRVRWPIHDRMKTMIEQYCTP